MKKLFGLVTIALLVAGEGEICNNGCGNDSKNWCNKKRRTGDGAEVRCVDKTRDGANCESSCKKGKEDYYWCWIGWHMSEDWEYCAPEGQTRYGVRCVSECAKNGENYWWCNTEYDNNLSPTKWEYCSPPSQVETKKLTYTRHGQECLGDCDTHGENYWWCKKSRRWGGKHADTLWDYCSPKAIQSSGSGSTPFKGKARTRYNKPCKDGCAGRDEQYFWCNTLDGSWDYCSPEVAATEPVIAHGGRPCAGICDYMGESYTWCSVISVTDSSIKGSSSTWWDYCGPNTSTLNAISSAPLLASAALIITFLSF